MIFCLETPRLRLRELTIDDGAFLLELLNEPGWQRFIGDRGVRTIDDARRYIAVAYLPMYTKLGFGLWLVETRDPIPTPVGLCGLLRREGLEDVDLGFALIERHQGRGYAHEAAAAVVDYAREPLRLRRLVAITAPDNARSGRLLEKLGFRFERMIRLPDKPESRFYVRTERSGSGTTA